MKAICLAVVVCLGLPSLGAGQGQVVFYNRIIGSLMAPVFGPEPEDSSIELHGNPPFGAMGGFPAGTQSYGGLRLAGSGYTAQLWGGPLPPGPGYDPVLQLAATTSFRTGIAAGFLASNTVVFVPGVLPGERAALELRVWDNQAGTITAWSQVLADPMILRGQSGVFSPPGPLGGILPDGEAFLPQFLVGLESFNIHNTVPEPALAWLAATGMAAVWLRRRRKG